MTQGKDGKGAGQLAGLIAPALLLALGFFMRVWGAWIYEYAHTSDHGIICLMVKHMLEGKAFPVFFYGLPYMGSIEPAISAALCAVFGLTGFWINMGTALVAFAFLPLVYLWGRGAAGRTAGLAALAFCVIGPPQYFQFVSWADGGYAAIPFFSCLVLVLTVRLLTREAAGERTSHWRFLFLGLAAGLGWWQSPLLIAAFLVSALLFLMVLRARVFSLRLVSGAAGFLLGSLPLWIWNFQNRWQTFDMVKTHDSPSLAEGLKLFYFTRLPDLLEFFRHPPWIRIVLGALVLLLAALALIRLIEALRARSREQALYLGAAVLFLIVFSILFGRSRFARVNALRYVLIVIPAMGVLLGAATAWLTARTRWGLGWLPVAALVALQAVELPKRPPERARTVAFVPRAHALAAFLREKGIRHLYTDYQVRGANHGLNFLLNEEFVFSPQIRERYRPYAAAMELSDRPAVLNNSLGFESFLAATRATASTGEVEGIIVHYDAGPPPELGPLVPAIEWLAVIGPGAAGAREALTDADAGTGWTLPGTDNRKAVLEIRFKGEWRVAGVRLFSEGTGPSAIGVEGWRESEQAWTPLLAETPTTRYFWSGPRFYWGGPLFRHEVRFEPLRTDRIRLWLAAPARGRPCDIQELQVFEAAAPTAVPAGPRAVEELARALRARGLTRVYTDRWEANALHRAGGGEGELSLLRHVFGRNVLGPEVALDERTGIVVREREAQPTRSVLAERREAARETAVGPWVLFDFPAEREHPSTRRSPGLIWTGVGCVKAAVWRLETDAAWSPGIPVSARFKGGMELAGVEFEPRVAPGATFRMKFYWRVPPAAAVDGLVVFVHFKAGGETVFQDDRPFLAGRLPAAGSAESGVIVEERRVTVPAGIAPGEVTIELGLYRLEGKARRLPVRSEFRGRKNEVIVPQRMVVGEAFEKQGL